MHKKIVIIITIIVTILLITKKENTSLVSSEIDENNYNNYQKIYLLFNNNKLTTNNLNEYFKNNKIKILSITPYINPIIKEQISENITYYFTNNSIEYNINRFIRLYTSKANTYKNLNNYDYIINGITINKVVVYSSIEEIEKININNIKYSFNNSGPYQKLK